MSLPPGFLDELRARLPLSRVVGRRVAWDQRRSNQAKGDLWAPCPFHQEKTASFHVDDRKGFYYCFGCQAKGDAISFLQQTDNCSFVEAVEILAREAGMAMPARDAQAAERAARAAPLAEAMEAAVAHYRLQLATRAAEAARAYLARRGLSPEAQARWEIGWAPEDRQHLSRALAQKGIAPDLLAEVGLTGAGQGGERYDRFAGRIIFPIRDARGRAVGLGGRALDPNARAKYLNSPQTPLFDKGRLLFNHARAREAAGRGAPLIVAEGYMDVIALSEAGFPGAVAPLGTAVTEDQLRLLWRLADEPVVALDGDAAGRRAAMRLIDLALPLLEAPKGLRFALLPPGQDPDDLLRTRGAGAMRALLDAAQPMLRLLWQRETEGRVLDSPERRAALDRRLREAVRAIRDPSLRRHYVAELQDLRAALWGQPRGGPRAGGARGRAGPESWRPRRATAAAQSSALAAPATEVRNLIWDVQMAPEAGADLLGRAVLAILLVHPALLPEVAHEVETLDCPHPAQARLRDALLRHAGAPDLFAVLAAEGGAEGVEALLADAHIVALRPPGDVEAARLALAEALARLAARRSLAAALREAEEEIATAQDERVTVVLAQVAAPFDPARRMDGVDAREVVVAPNGVALDKAETERASRQREDIDFSRGGRGGHVRRP